MCIVAETMTLGSWEWKRGDRVNHRPAYRRLGRARSVCVYSQEIQPLATIKTSLDGLVDDSFHASINGVFVSLAIFALLSSR